LFILGASAFAQTVSAMRKDEILDNLSKLENLEQENYEEAIFELNDEVNNYSDLRKKECLGEFSTLEINNEGESVGKKKKLSREEKKLCQIELINFRKKYIKNIYKIRRRHLLKNHKEQLEKLDALELDSLKELDEITQKIR
jgi:nucleoid DNA-binding protein